MKIELDMYQTLAVAVLVLMLGKFLRARVQVLERFCIPAPVIGGVLFAIFTCVCYVTGVAEFAFDDILKEVCMVMFFTSVGFQANLKVLNVQQYGGGRVAEIRIIDFRRGNSASSFREKRVCGSQFLQNMGGFRHVYSYLQRKYGSDRRFRYGSRQA